MLFSIDLLYLRGTMAAPSLEELFNDSRFLQFSLYKSVFFYRHLFRFHPFTSFSLWFLYILIFYSLWFSIYLDNFYVYFVFVRILQWDWTLLLLILYTPIGLILLVIRVFALIQFYLLFVYFPYHPIRK